MCNTAPRRGVVQDFAPDAPVFIVSGSSKLVERRPQPPAHPDKKARARTHRHAPLLKPPIAPIYRSASVATAAVICCIHGHCQRPRATVPAAARTTVTHTGQAIFDATVSPSPAMYICTVTRR